MSKKIAEEIENGRRGTRGPEYMWLHRVPGTSAFNAKHRRDLAVQRAWLGPPPVFITVTCSSMTNDILASWVVQEARLRGKVVDVITSKDERAKLTLRPGYHQQPVVQTTYAVHTRGSGGPLYDNCPYHTGCHREMLSNYVQR